MSKRFKDLKPGDHIFIIEPNLACPKMYEVIVHTIPQYRDNTNVYFSVEYKKGYLLDLPSVPAEKSYHNEDRSLTISTNRERAVSYHKKALRELLDRSSNNIVREMRVSEEILYELRQTEKISHGKE